MKEDDCCVSLYFYRVKCNTIYQQLLLRHFTINIYCDRNMLIQMQYDEIYVGNAHL